MLKHLTSLTFLVLLSILFINNSIAQNLQTGTALARLSDLDNNEYANIGDMISLQVYADGLTGPGGIGDSIFVCVVFSYYGSADTLYLTKNTSSGTSGGGYGNDVFFSLSDNAIASKTSATGFNNINVRSCVITCNRVASFCAF